MDCDGTIDIGDLTGLISCLYIAPETCPVPIPCDWQCDGEVDIGDLTAMIRYLYLGGEPPHCQP